MFTWVRCKECPRPVLGLRESDLYLSFNTVKSHARAIYRKLVVSSLEEAVEQAHLRGLIG
jgi:hypothetical protein